MSHSSPCAAALCGVGSSIRSVGGGSGTHHVTHSRPHSTSAPTVALVGTMGYAKGDFAFFSSNDAEQKKVLSVSEKIAGYTVKEIRTASVVLETADKKSVEMKVGDLLRQENGQWELAGAGEVPSGSATAYSSPAEGSASGPSAAPAVSPDLEANDVLKRLMQKREQENK